MASVAGKNQFVRERLARIAMIEAKMREIMQGVDTSLISKQSRLVALQADDTSTADTMRKRLMFCSCRARAGAGLACQQLQRWAWMSIFKIAGSSHKRAAVHSPVFAPCSSPESLFQGVVC
jgi:peptide deformylase